MADDKTIAKTLWSETLIDALIVAIQKKASDDKVKEIIKELQQKGYKSNYLIQKVTKELDQHAAHRVKLLMGK